MSSVTHWLLNNILLNLHVFVYFEFFFPLVFDFWAHSLVVRKNNYYDFNLLKFIETCFLIHLATLCLLIG